MKRLLFPAFLLVLFFAACKQPIDGGACTYTIDTVTGHVIRMDSLAVKYPEIYIEIPRRQTGTDTLSYYVLTGESPTWDSCKARGIAVGAELKIQCQYITSGSCTPEIFTLVK